MKSNHLENNACLPESRTIILLKFAAAAAAGDDDCADYKTENTI